MSNVVPLPVTTQRPDEPSLLHTEITQLRALGVTPTQVVALARALNFEPLLTRAFPLMPEDMRAALMQGTSQFICDRFNHWILIHIEE